MDLQDKAGLAAVTEVLLRKISGFLEVDDEIKSTIAGICDDHQEFRAGTVLVPQGGHYGDVLLLESGWVLRARHMENGARQIVNVVLPGDFVAMNALLFATSDFELSCKTDITAFRLPSNRLGTALMRNAILSAALFWVNAHEESLLAERIVSLGRRSARERATHVLCELISRLEITGISNIEQLVIPMSQEEFSDILGISVVHMNKTLRALEQDGILSFRNSLLRVLDKKRLETEAGFNDGYIHFTRREDQNAWRPTRLIDAR
ncbi:MAG: Crp/Fnr family transcriptional regulator [Silicimonas sp.]|nr:Crp/Fnr family transcriptional regulator [Silicimonas sp.]